jgi:hypothetical protein
VVFKMNKKIENPTESEVRAVIRFLYAQNVRPIEIYHQLIAVYGEGVITVKCEKVVHDEKRSRSRSLIMRT